MVKEIEKRVPPIRFLHASNGPAALRFPKFHFKMVRVGRAIYGVSPIPRLPATVRLRPALQFKSRVGLVKDLRGGETIGYGRTFVAKRRMKVALVACGYADGIPRAVSNKGWVLIGGQRCRILGRVSMDLLTADVSRLKGVRIGDEVVLIGRQEKSEITVDEVATWAGTIAHEILARIGARVPRIYID